MNCCHGRSWNTNLTLLFLALVLSLFIAPGLLAQDAQQDVQDAQEAPDVEEVEDVQPLTSEDCVMCHEESSHGTDFGEDLSHSIHRVFECLDCHIDKDTDPHDATSDFVVGCEGCRMCHDDAGDEYQAHGRAAIGTCEDMPQCKDCHGDHDVLPSSVKNAKTHPVNLPATCGRCHQNIELTKKYDILIDNPITIYERSVHGMAAKGGVYVAATCNDCHSTGGTAHKIFAPGHAESSINHFNIPQTCGQCHKGVESDFMEGIHGKLVARGETDAPVCTNCHGEHGITSPDDPRSPVSASRLAEETCSPCHESAVLNEKYGLPSGRLATFIDSYHGLKSKAGDTHVANCASCHGVHRILPSSNPSSTVHKDNLQHTCGDCHPGISEKMAAMPIHGVTGEGLRTPLADLVEKIYIIAIVVIIGLMVLHWLIDLGRHIKLMMERRPQVRRMRLNEVWQHTFLMVSFITLVASGFALTYDESFLAKVFFGWEGGFAIRGLVHRVAAVIFSLVVVWHTLYLIFSRRGREYFTDMLPAPHDFTQFWHRILYCIGRRKESPRFHRFSYVEKAEYWALVWGTAVMVVTGLLLWFDNWFIGFLPKGFLDVALVVHFWEAWLASLAILVWHLYSTVFNPAVYPMNPSWLTGLMPEEMYRHEFPEHVEQAKKETEDRLRKQLENVSSRSDQDPGTDE